VSVVGTVAAREYLQRVRSPAFLIGTLAAPLLFLAFVALTSWLGGRFQGEELPVGLVDRSGELAEGLSPRLREAGFQVEELAAPPPERSLRWGEEPLSRVTSGELAAILEVDEETLRAGRAVWWGEEPPAALRRIVLRQAVAQAAREERMREEDDDGARSLLRGGVLEIVLAEDGEDDRSRAAGVVLGGAGAFLLYFALLVYGAMVLRSVLEEKTARIVEVVLSSVRPWELMLGKILGVGAVGLTQLSAWLLSGALIATAASWTVLPLLAETRVREEMTALVPGAGLVAFFALCFLLGYLIYSSIFAAVGSMCTTEEEAQQLQIPVVMVVLIPFIFLFPVLQEPSSRLAVALSLFPLFSPILMFARVAVGEVPAWQALLSVVGMLGALWVVAWVAGRIYRTGILMQGKRPTLPEIWRWVRTG
jgi:ABC-2 type transport system permease protein